MKTDYKDWHWQCLGRELGRLCPRLKLIMPANYNALMFDTNDWLMRTHIDNLIGYWMILDATDGELIALREAIKTKLKS